MLIALDVDGTFTAYPDFFISFIPAMREQGHKVGVLTGRPEAEHEGIKKAFVELGVSIDFFIGKPDTDSMSNGEFKALVCNEMEVAYLFDDFQDNDPKMVRDFFYNNKNTRVFSCFLHEVKGD